MVAGDVEGAGVVAQVLVAVRARPEIGAGFEDGVGPAAVGLEPVVSTTQGRELAGTRDSTGRMRGDVVTVAGMVIGPEAAGGAGAPRKHTRHIPKGHGV